MIGKSRTFPTPETKTRKSREMWVAGNYQAVSMLDIPLDFSVLLLWCRTGYAIELG
jgi:hypothetical protein